MSGRYACIVALFSGAISWAYSFSQGSNKKYCGIAITVAVMHAVALFILPQPTT